MIDDAIKNEQKIYRCDFAHATKCSDVGLDEIMLRQIYCTSTQVLFSMSALLRAELFIIEPDMPFSVNTMSG